MTLPSYLDFSANIRTHGAFVGVMIAVDAIATLLMGAGWNVKTEDLPDELKHIGHVKGILLVAGIAEALFAVIFWIGFLKRIRWCLTVFVGFIAVALTLEFIALLGAILQLSIVSACFILIVLAANAYALLVVLQLRKANSNEMVPEEEFKI